MTTASYEQSPPLEELTRGLTKQVQVLSEYIRGAGYTQPSFNRDTPIVVLPESAPRHAHSAREHVMDYALKIFQLAAGPSEYLANLQTGYHYVACLQWLCHFQIFSHVPLVGKIPYSELANLAQVPESRLKAVVRMALTNGLLSEPSPQCVAHSATSALLATNENFRDWAIFMCDISAPTAAAMAAAQKRWPAATEKTQTAYNVALHTDIPFFQYLGQVPGRHKQFSGYMKAVTASQGTAMKHLVDGYDWASLGKALVVDVGGSTGHASIALANAYPELDFVVEDLPEVVARGEENVDSVDKSLRQRIKFQPQDIFEPQAIQGADVYLLRMILHDWSAEDSVKILSNLLPALKKDSRIIVMDTVLPNPGSIPSSKERLLRVRDLTMVQVFNAGERAREDWNAIFEKTHPKLKCLNVSQPVGSVMSLTELVLENE